MPIVSSTLPLKERLNGWLFSNVTKEWAAIAWNKDAYRRCLVFWGVTLSQMAVPLPLRTTIRRGLEQTCEHA